MSLGVFRAGSIARHTDKQNTILRKRDGTETPYSTPQTARVNFGPTHTLLTPRSVERMLYKKRQHP
jgi:hypothetical protein